MALDAFREEYALIIHRIEEEFERNSNKIASIFPRAMTEKDEVTDYNINEARYFALETRVVNCEDDIAQYKKSSTLGSKSEQHAHAKRQRSRSPERTESPPPSVPVVSWDTSAPAKKSQVLDKLTNPAPHPQPRSRIGSRPNSAYRPSSAAAKRPSSAAARLPGRPAKVSSNASADEVTSPRHPKLVWAYRDFPKT